jgi:hypothetical protein
MDSPYYFESELCGGVMTVSFQKSLSWQAMHFLQRSTHFSKTCCRPLITSKFLASELTLGCCKSPEIAWGRDLDCTADVLMGFHRSTFSKPNTEFNPHLAPCDFWASPTMKKELRGKSFQSDQRSAARLSRSGWSVVRSASLAKGGTSKKRPSPHLHKVPTRSNKVSPRTLQMVLVNCTEVMKLL